MGEYTERVELHVYAREGEEIVIDKYKARNWEDFLIIDIEAQGMTQERWNELHNVLAPIAAQMEKQVIIIPRHIDIQFYGVEKIVTDTNSKS